MRILVFILLIASLFIAVNSHQVKYVRLRSHQGTLLCATKKGYVIHVHQKWAWHKCTKWYVRRVHNIWGRMTIGLKNVRNHKYLVAEKNMSVRCNRPLLKRWEKFTLYRTKRGEYGLRSWKKRFLVAEKGRKVRCNRPWLKLWEKWRFEIRWAHAK